MKSRLILLGGLLLTGFLARPAPAQLFSSQGLDPAYCDRNAVRQTVVYIDDMMMEDGHTEWATKLATKLKATLAPGEHVSIVQLTPATGQSAEVWSGCWPDVSDQERVRLAKEKNFSDFFTRDKLAVLNEQKAFFTRDFGIALTKIYQATKRTTQAVRIVEGSAPTKQLIRALASDEGRFSQNRDAVTIRAIVYSNLAEHSDLGSVLRPLPDQPVDYGKKLGSYLRRSVFYIYGVGENVRDVSGFPETAKLFWYQALRSMAATVGGAGSDLNISNNVPIRSYSFEVMLEQEGRLDGRLSVLVDREGSLVDSWIGISRLTSAGLQGSLRCRSAPDGPCLLEATTTNGIVTRSPSEVLTLSGNPQSGMSGKLGLRNTEAMYAIKVLPRER